MSDNTNNTDDSDIETTRQVLQLVRNLYDIERLQHKANMYDKAVECGYIVECIYCNDTILYDDLHTHCKCNFFSCKCDFIVPFAYLGDNYRVCPFCIYGYPKYEENDYINYLFTSNSNYNVYQFNQKIKQILNDSSIQDYKCAFGYKIIKFTFNNREIIMREHYFNDMVDRLNKFLS